MPCIQAPFHIQALSGETLELLPRGLNPLGTRNFGGGDGRLRPPPYLAAALRRHDRPPTHFFVKKKFSYTSGVGTPPHAGGSFFLYEKSVLRESDSLRGRKPEVCTDLTPPLFRP